MLFPLVIKVITNNKLHGSVFHTKSPVAPLLMEFHVLYNVTVHYSAQHGLSLVHCAAHNTILYV